MTGYKPFIMDLIESAVVEEMQERDSKKALRISAVSTLEYCEKQVEKLPHPEKDQLSKTQTRRSIMLEVSGPV